MKFHWFTLQRFIFLVPVLDLLLADELDYNRDVRPILSDKCFKCHGPDAKNQRSDFRIDTFAHATEDLGGYAGIIPGNIDDSEVHWRLVTDDESELMPPPKSKMSLTPEEIDIITRWIKEGAEYQEHWSYVPVAETVPAPESDSDWVRNPIDEFIVHRLEQEQFKPSQETSREQWLRRVTFDLTGLPPTLGEVDSFVADAAPDAFEKVVDRLFATPAYGERMANEWLDVARYSDTFGYQQDWDRYVWPWRDWVIRAFQEGMPYDQFITEQLAGDLLQNSTRDQILATTFNRLHSQKVEGGSVPEEFRIEYVADRVHTYGTAFLGLSFECSRCHDHKYDPLTMRDYYEMAAFFDNIDEAGLYAYFPKGEGNATPTPTLWLPNETQESELQDLNQLIDTSESRLNEFAADAAEDYKTWLASTLDRKPAADPIAHFSFESVETNKISNEVEGGEPASTTARNTLVDGRNGKAILLTGDDKVTLPAGNFTRNDPFSISLWLQTPDEKERAVIFSRSKAWTDA
ncbi:MAG: DUF1549 domain-containing protein, partial [Verrucomicrobiota bacterium]